MRTRRFIVSAHRIETVTQIVEETDNPHDAIEKALNKPNDWSPGPFRRIKAGWEYTAEELPA